MRTPIRTNEARRAAPPVGEGFDLLAVRRRSVEALGPDPAAAGASLA